MGQWPNQNPSISQIERDLAQQNTALFVTIMPHGKCYRCKTKTEWVLNKTIATNGALMIFWVCTDCHKRSEKARFIPHEELRKRKINFDEIKTYTDNRHYEKCARCGRIDTEYHHWAPKHLFDDANAWPGDYLCKACHKIWHDTVTPHMSKKHE